MPAYLQPALGSGIGITDYRSHCQMYHSLYRDMGAQNERDLRGKLMEDPVEAKALRLKYIPIAPYFETDRCWMSDNPKVAFPHYTRQ